MSVFIRARHWFLLWTRWIHSTTSHAISLISILILSSYLRIGFPSGLLPSGLRPKFYLTPWKCPRYSMDRRLGELQSRSGRGGEEKNSQPLPGLESPIIQSAAQRYTDSAIPAPDVLKYRQQKCKGTSNRTRNNDHGPSPKSDFLCTCFRRSGHQQGISRMLPIFWNSWNKRSLYFLQKLK
jgi:hypothetical protein